MQPVYIGAALVKAGSVTPLLEAPVTAVVQTGSVTQLLEHPVTAVVQAGSVALLRDDGYLRHRALDELISSVFRSNGQTITVDIGVIPKLINFLAYEDALAARAIVSLGNVALHGREARDAVLYHGGVHAMLPYMRKSTPIRRLRTFVRTYSSLCSHDDGEPKFELVSPALPHICEILDVENEESLDFEKDKQAIVIARDVLVAACTALTNIMHGPDECIEGVQAAGRLTARLVQLLGHDATDVREAALNAVGNMLAGGDAQMYRCLDAGCLQHIVSLLQSRERCLVREAARAASNILAGTHLQIQRALHLDILTPLRNILADGDPECQKEAACAISHLCYNGSAAQRSQLVWSGVLQPYCALLARPDAALALHVLDSLYELMQAGAGEGSLKCLCYVLDELDVLDLMQPLQDHATDEDHRNKMSYIRVTIRKLAREERVVVHDNETFTAEKIVRGLSSVEHVSWSRASRAAYRMLREPNPPVNGLLEAGIMAPLLRALDRDQTSDSQYLATWALSIFTAGTRKYRMAVVNSGAMRKLIALLVQGDKVSELAACCLGDMVLYEPETRDTLLTYTRSERVLTELRTYIMLYSEVCLESAVYHELLLRALPLVYVLLFIEDQDIMVIACTSCATLTSDRDKHHHNTDAVQAVPGLTARLMALMGHQNTTVQAAALIAVINMLGGTDTQTDRCLEAGCIEHVLSILQSSEPSLASLAAWATCGILGHTNSIQQGLAKDILSPIINILADGENKSQMQVASAITNLCIKASAEQRSQLMSSGLLEPFCALLVGSDAALAERVLNGLYILIQNAVADNTAKPLCSELDKIGFLDHLKKLQERNINKDLRNKAVELGGIIRQQVRKEHLFVEYGVMFTIEDILQDLKSLDLATQKRGAEAAFSMLRKKNDVRCAMVEAGVIDPLAAALGRDDNPDLQLIVVYAFVIIVKGTHKHRVAIVNSGAIPKLIALLSQGGDVADAAAWVLGHVTERAPVSRDVVLSHGALHAMLPLMRPDTPKTLLRNCVSAYLKICTAIVSRYTFNLVSSALPHISELLTIEDQDVLNSACSALANLIQNLEERIEVVQATPRLITRLVTLMDHRATIVQQAAMSVVSNMLAGSTVQVDRCLEAGCLEYIVYFLHSSESCLVEPAAQAAVNIVRHTHSHTKKALDKGILAPLMNILANAEPNSYLQYYVVSALSNMTNHEIPEHRKAVVDAGAIPLLVSILSNEAAVAEQAANTLSNIAINNPGTRDVVLSHGAVQAMLPHMRVDAPLDLLKYCVQALWSWSCDVSSSSMYQLLLPALPNVISVILATENPQILQSACSALANLTSNHKCIDVVQSVPGLMVRLVTLLTHKCTDVIRAALSVMTNMLNGTKLQVDRCLDAGYLDYVLAFLRSSEPYLVVVAAQAVGKILIHSHSCMKQALEKDTHNVPKLVIDIIANAEPNSHLQWQALYALANFAADGTNKHRLAVVRAGGVPKLVGLLASEAKIAEEAGRTLAHIARAGPVVCYVLLACGTVRAILPHLRADAPLGLLRSCVATVQNLCTGIVSTPMLNLVIPALPYISQLLDIENLKVLESACGALGNLILCLDECKEAIQAVPGLKARLVVLLGHEAFDVKDVAVRIMCDMVAGSDIQVDDCLDAGCLDGILALLNEGALIDGAVKIICNILNHTPTQIQRALDKGILPPLLILLADAEPNSSDEYNIVTAITNITVCGTRAQMEAVVHAGAIPRLVACLGHGAKVAKLAAVSLITIAKAGLETVDLMLSHGAVDAMLPLLRLDTPLHTLSACLAVYNHLCRYDPDNPIKNLKLLSPALPQIADLLTIGDKSILMHACIALLELPKTIAVIEAIHAVPGFLTRLLALLDHETTEIKLVALNIVCCMADGNDIQVDRCLDAGCLKYVRAFLDHSDPSLVAGAVKTTCNILTHTPTQIQRVLDMDILPPLLNILADAEDNSDLQFCVIAAIIKFIIRGTRAQRAAIVHAGVIPRLVALLAHKGAAALLVAQLLENLASDGPEVVQLVLSHGTVDAMLPLLRLDTPLDILRSCVKAYRQFCRHDPDNPIKNLKLLSPALPQISDLLTIGDKNVLEHTCLVLVEYSRTTEGIEAIHAVPRLTARLGTLLGHKAVRVKHMATAVVMTALWTLYSSCK